MEVIASVLIVVVSLAIGGFVGSWGFSKVVTKVAEADYHQANHAVAMEVGPNARAIYVPPSPTAKANPSAPPPATEQAA